MQIQYFFEVHLLHPGCVSRWCLFISQILHKIHQQTNQLIFNLCVAVIECQIAVRTWQYQCKLKHTLFQFYMDHMQIETMCTCKILTCTHACPAHSNSLNVNLNELYTGFVKKKYGVTNYQYFNNGNTQQCFFRHNKNKFYFLLYVKFQPHKVKRN